MKAKADWLAFNLGEGGRGSVCERKEFMKIKY
jgi:hypothetical protein